MKYRKFGKLDWEVSALGFGAMRLPITGDIPAAGNPDINEPEAIRMIRHSIDQGVNYLDTAYPCHGGKSEVVVGNALKDGYREKIKLATKMPSWFIQEYGDFDKYLNEQLGKLQTDHIDFYLLHGQNKQHWPKLRDLDVLKWAEKTIADGRIPHLGFSFHDDLDMFKQIVDAYDQWTFCQIQYNFMDIEYQAGTKGLQYAAEKGLAVVIMEPLRGGQLSKEPPESVKEIWKRSSIKRSPVDWALQWLWNQPEISVVLSGMSTVAQVDENLASADRSGPGSLSADEGRLVEEVAAPYTGLQPIPCTRCNYCMPCPSGVNIPHNLGLYNTAVMYDRFDQMRRWYAGTKAEERASACTDCDQCEEKCPQKIMISDWMPRID